MDSTYIFYKEANKMHFFIQTVLEIVTLYRIDQAFNTGMPMLSLSSSTGNSRA
jgi:hypothetical protein